MKVDNNLIKKAIFMVGNANFSASYDIISYGDKEEYTGPDDLKTCICRFCGKKYPEVRFKKKMLMQFLMLLGINLFSVMMNARVVILF